MSTSTLTPAATTTPTAPVIHPLVKQAEEKVAAQLGLQPFQVEITKGEDERGWRRFTEGDDQTTLNLIVNAPGSMFDKTVTDGLREKMKQWAPVQKWQWEDRSKLTVALEDKLKKGTSDIPEFNKEFFTWPQFKPAIAKKPYRVKSYAAESIGFYDYGVIVNLTIPREDGLDSTPALKKLADSINDATRNNEIKEILTARIVDKYIEAKMKAGGTVDDKAITTARDKARQDMAQLIIHAEVNADCNGVKVSLRSPKQVQERAKVPNDYAESPNKSELQAENPIYLLDNTITKENPHPQAQKALARALLFNKNKQPIPQFFDIAGNVDYEKALEGYFKHLLKTYPGKKEVFDEILKSPILKDRYVHDPKQPNASLEEANFKGMGNKTDMIRIELPIEEKNIRATLEAMANGVAVTMPATPVIAPATSSAATPTANTDVNAALNDAIAAQANDKPGMMPQNASTTLGRIQQPPFTNVQPEIREALGQPPMTQQPPLRQGTVEQPGLLDRLSKGVSDSVTNIATSLGLR